MFKMLFYYFYLFLSKNLCNFVPNFEQYVYFIRVKMNRRFYVISYDLKISGRDYTSLYEAIKSYNEWQHPLESTWIVYTSETANAISAKLRSDGKMDNSDLLFVCALEINDRQGWLDKSVWNWIKSHIK